MVLLERFLVALSFFVYGATSSAAPKNETPTNSSLYLLATTQQVRLLNQKLEYRVIDANSIQIGNLVVSTKNLKMRMKDNHTATLEGPFQFMVGSQLIIKDPLGQALWSKTIEDPSELEIDTNSVNKEMGPRHQSARYSLTDFDSLATTLSQNSFFTFCIFSETNLNRIQACTPNYALRNNNGSWVLQNTKGNGTENLIVVNGTEVNEHGIIQFDANIKTVSLASKLSSGLSLEVKTDYVELELLDIAFDEAKELVRLKLREKRKGAKKVYPWDSQISLKDPFLYIEALGQVPLRQELAISKDELPLESDRPPLLKEFNKTYSSSVSLIFANQEPFTLSARTKGDSLHKEDNTLIWTLDNLRQGFNRPHLLSIAAGKKKVIGAYEIERGTSWILSGNLGGGSTQQQSQPTTETSSKNSLYYQVALQKYFDSFLGLDGFYNYLRWGLHLSYDHRQIAKQNSDSIEADVSYRFSPGFHHSEASTNLHLSFLQNSTQTPELNNPIQSQWFGCKFGHVGPNSMLKWLLGDNHESYLGLFPTCLNDECKNTTVTNFYWLSRYDFMRTAFWSWKIYFEQTQTKNSNLSVSTLTSEMHLGLGFQF